MNCNLRFAQPTSATRLEPKSSNGLSQNGDGSRGEPKSYVSFWPRGQHTGTSHNSALTHPIPQKVSIRPPPPKRSRQRRTAILEDDFSFTKQNAFKGLSLLNSSQEYCAAHQLPGCRLKRTALLPTESMAGQPDTAPGWLREGGDGSGGES